MRPRHAVILEVYPHVLGGSQRTNRVLAEHLPSEGWTTEVVVPHDGPAAAALRQAGVTVNGLGADPALGRYGADRAPKTAVALALVRWWATLARHLRAVRAAVVLAGDHRGLILAGPAARLARVPLVWHLHSAEPSRLLNRLAGRLPEAVVVPSAGAAARFGRRRTTVVPPALDPVPLPAAAAAGTETRRVLTVGRLHPDKGVDVLLEAVARARAEVPGMVLDVVGGEQPGHEAHAAALREQARGLGIDGLVRWRGGDGGAASANPDTATVYVSASRRETFGLALAEAMAAGLAVVATSTDGSRALVDHERTGLLVAPGDVDGIAAAMVALLTDSVRSRRLGDAARPAVLARCALGPVVAAEAAVLASVAR